jgi:tetratricopeptide (TPR) repeat protein
VDSDDDVKMALEAVFLYQIDAEKGEGKDLAKEFNIKGYPMFVMVNVGGETLDRWIGYEKNYFIKTMDSALKDLSTIEDKLASYEKKPTAGIADVLGRYSSSLEEYVNAVNYYTTAQKIKDQPSDDYTYEIFYNISYGLESEHFTFEDARAAADVVLKSETAEPEEVVRTAIRVTRMAKKNDRLDIIGPYIETGLKITSQADDPEAKDAHNQLMIEKSLHITGDKKAAVRYKMATMADGWLEDAGKLNGFCWWCFENSVNLEDAERLSRKSVELAEPGKRKAMNLDTLAEICNALDNCLEAVELIKMAMAEDPESKHYPEQLKKFEENLASQN